MASFSGKKPSPSHIYSPRGVSGRTAMDLFRSERIVAMYFDDEGKEFSSGRKAHDYADRALMVENSIAEI
jgi:hypothetical protein